MLLVAQWEDEPLERHASQPRSRADEVAIPVASITADAGAELRAASAAAVRVVPSARVRASTWRKLGELAEGVGWPRGREARDDLIAVWRRTAAGWPDREAALQRGIEIVDPGRRRRVARSCGPCSRVCDANPAVRRHRGRALNSSPSCPGI